MFLLLLLLLSYSLVAWLSTAKHHYSGNMICLFQTKKTQKKTIINCAFFRSRLKMLLQFSVTLLRKVWFIIFITSCKLVYELFSLLKGHIISVTNALDKINVAGRHLLYQLHDFQVTQNLEITATNLDLFKWLQL